MKRDANRFGRVPGEVWVSAFLVHGGQDFWPKYRSNSDAGESPGVPSEIRVHLIRLELLPGRSFTKSREKRCNYLGRE